MANNFYDSRVKKPHVHPMFPDAFRVRGSVILEILGPCLIFTAYSVIIYLLSLKHKVASNMGLAAVMAVVVGLLLVFRTNSAYDRYWTGRTAWGNLTTASRNLMRVIWVLAQQTPEGLLRAKHVLNLVLAYQIAVRRWLRSEHGPQWDDLKHLLPINIGLDEDLAPLPSRIAYLVTQYLATEKREGRLEPPVFGTALTLVNSMTEQFGHFERILITPIPLAYLIHLKQIIYIFFITLPFQIVGLAGGVTIIVQFLAAFTFFGIEAIGKEIENPFGYDPNDLPQEDYADWIEKEIAAITDPRFPLVPVNEWKFVDSKEKQEV